MLGGRLRAIKGEFMLQVIVDDDKNELYEVKAQIKSGGFGTVYSGLDTKNNLPVAIKLIDLYDDKYFDAINREVDIAFQLSHKNIIKTYKSGFDKDNNQFYIVMDYHKNGSLDNYLAGLQSYLSLETCLQLFEGILNGIEYAHKTIIHRDLKPSNILISNQNEMVICDFGMSKYIGDSTLSFSYKGGGTYAYMSPEAWSNETNTPIMDIYSLGIIFFEILTLKKPYTASTPLDYKDLHIYEPLPNISSIRKDVPIKLKEIIVKMTNKRRQQRYSSVTEVIASLNEVKQQNSETNQIADGLAGLVHSQMLQNQIKIAVQEKAKNDQILRIKSINFVISELITKIKEIVESTNNRLEQNKIEIIESKNAQGLIEITVKHSSKSLSIHFFGVDDVKYYSEENRKESRDRQNREHMMILYPPSETTLEKEKIILVGAMQIRSSFQYSLNLLLIKDKPDDEYGEWSIAIFKDAFVTRGELKDNYCLGRNIFYKEYDICRHAMHARSVDVKKLDDSEIQKWLTMTLI